MFGEVYKTVTILDWLVVKDVNSVIKTRIEHYSGNLPPWVKSTRMFGKSGTVKTGKDGKVGNH